jgi:ABC-type polysaccharide/polyol phosphate export permease
MLKDMLSFYRHRGLIANFVKRDLSARYKGSAMGIFWSVVQPLVMLVLYTYVFSAILKVRVGPGEGTDIFAIYLFCGLLPWNAFHEGVSRSATVILDNANLIKRTIFPAEILPVYVVASGLVNELIGLGILLGAVLLTAKTISPVLLLLPVVLLLQGTFTIGLAWIIAAINVFVRDVGQLLGMVLTLWLFLTPVFYPPSLVPPSMQWILFMNPMMWVVESYRSIILRGAMPSSTGLLALALCSSTTFVIGRLLFRRMQGAFADVI